MKKILTLAFLLFLFKAQAQTFVSVKAVGCGGNNYFVRVTFAETFVPAHDISTTTCPDGSLHNDTEEGTYMDCTMELFGDAACTQPITVDPRFFAFARDLPGSGGTRDNPTIVYRYTCPAPMPVGPDYAKNYRIDHSAISITQCIWECVGAGYYNCYPTDFGEPVNFNIVVNCCYAPEVLAVHLLDFSGVRGSGSNRLSWVLADTSDFLRLEVERSFDGVQYAVVFSTSSVAVSSFTDAIDVTAYYRIRVYDKNGSWFYSAVVVLKAAVDLKKSFSVSPSPFVSLLRVNVTAVVSGRVVFRLVAVDGREMFRSTRNVVAGVNAFTFDIPPVAKGMYLFTMSDGEGTVARKVLKD